MFQRFKFGQPKTRSGLKGYRAYAIGDVHGCLGVLEGLLGQIEADDRERSPARTILVFLGDLIDRGPDSAGVLRRLRKGGLPGEQQFFLAGNHEEVFLRVLQGEPGLLQQWLRFGGGQCLQSYGVDLAEGSINSEADAIARIQDAVPSADVEFLHSFADTFRFGDYLFVHAGIRPGVVLEMQAQSDLRWIRQPFLRDARDHGFVVVHGHTISEQIDDRRNRIGIDTGVYRTGVLTAIGIDGQDRWFLQQREADLPQLRDRREIPGTS